MYWQQSLAENNKLKPTVPDIPVSLSKDTSIAVGHGSTSDKPHNAVYNDTPDASEHEATNRYVCAMCDAHYGITSDTLVHPEIPGLWQENDSVVKTPKKETIKFTKMEQASTCRLSALAYFLILGYFGQTISQTKRECSQ